MQKPRLSERFRYWFDSVMSKGTVAIIGLLALATVVFIAVISAIVAIFRQGPTGDEGISFTEAMWGSLMRTLDSGTMGGDEGVGFRIAMLVVTIGGVIIVASLIGVISSAFDSKVEDLRKGRSRVIEKDHTLILGWSTKVFPIITEICTANESRGRAAIVVLADRDKVEMEDEIRSRVPNTGKTRIIVRSGSPMDLTDLEVASPHTTRSIIILAPEDSTDPDSAVIKTALALTNNPHRSSAPFHIVGELHNPASVEAATLVGRTEAHWVLASELISRIAVQSSRQSGLSIVYSDLLDFAGDEVYFTAQPSLVGRTVGEAQLAFATSTVIGVVTASGVELNPSPSRLIADTEQLIVIAEDDDRIELAPPRRGDPSRMSDEAPVAAAAERTLILGLNHELPTVVRELAEYVVAGSTVTIVAEGEAPELPDFPTLTVTVENADATSRAVLELIAPGTFDHIIVLSYKDTLEVQQADAKTLITLLHLRDIERRDGLTLNIVSEMLDDRNRELAEVTRADDFIVSDRLVSLVLSQLSENHRLHEVFDELLTSGGSEIYLRPVAEYITPGEPVDFYTVTEAAQRKGETALGYRIAAQAATSAVSFGVALNPDKTESVAFTEGDTIIVLAAG